MSSQLRRNGDGILTDCLCFGACCFPCPSISLPLAMFAMHHHSHSLSPSPATSSFLASSFLRGIAAMDGCPATCEEKLRKKTAVISEHSKKLCGTKTQYNRLFLIHFRSALLSVCLYSTHPLFYLHLHVIVCQLNLSNQQIRRK